MTDANNSRQRILAAALTLFREKGYASAGVSEIVLRAGITKPTLYYFFQSKAGVFAAILETYYSPLIEDVRSAAWYDPHPHEYDKDVFPVLCRLVGTYFSIARRHADFYLMLLSLAFAPPDAEVSPLVGAYQKEEQEVIMDLFSRIAESHGNMCGKERLLTASFLAHIRTAVSLWHDGGLELDDTSVQPLVKLFMHGIFA